MAFNRNKLILVSEHGVPSAPKLYLYTTTDTIATVNTADYFLTASRILVVGDTIIVHSSTGGTREVSLVIVNAVTIDSAIDVTDGLSLITGKQAGSKILVQGVIPDVSTAAAIFLMSPVAGIISSISTKLGVAITTADATLAAKVNAGTTMGGITIAYSGSAVGDLDTLVPTENNTVAVGDWIRIDTDGGSTVTSPVSVTVEISPTVGVDSD